MVFDGGGVEADVKVKLPKPSALEIALQVSVISLVFLFCLWFMLSIILRMWVFAVGTKLVYARQKNLARWG